MQAWNWDASQAAAAAASYASAQGYQPQVASVAQPNLVQAPLGYQQYYANAIPATTPDLAQQQQLEAQQQQHWQQWQQWQQQYQQWHQEYGDKYQASLNTLAAQGPVPPPVAVSAAQPPPLPPPDKPPPPPDEGFQPQKRQQEDYSSDSNKKPRYPYEAAPARGRGGRGGGRGGRFSAAPPEPEKVVEAKKESTEDLSEAEKAFDLQFQQWEEQFSEWKAQNINHPDKNQYREYEAKWRDWREKLLQRRVQMKKKREASATSLKPTEQPPVGPAKVQTDQHQPQRPNDQHQPQRPNDQHQPQRPNDQHQPQRPNDQPPNKPRGYDQRNNEKAGQNQWTNEPYGKDDQQREGFQHGGQDPHAYGDFRGPQNVNEPPKQEIKSLMDIPLGFMAPQAKGLQGQPKPDNQQEDKTKAPLQSYPAKPGQFVAQQPKISYNRPQQDRNPGNFGKPPNNRNVMNFPKTFQISSDICKVIEGPNEQPAKQEEPSAVIGPELPPQTEKRDNDEPEVIDITEERKKSPNYDFLKKTTDGIPGLDLFSDKPLFGDNKGSDTPNSNSQNSSMRFGQDSSTSQDNINLNLGPGVQTSQGQGFQFPKVQAAPKLDLPQDEEAQDVSRSDEPFVNENAQHGFTGTPGPGRHPGVPPENRPLSFNTGNQVPKFGNGIQAPNFPVNQGQIFSAINQGPNFNTINQGPHFNPGNKAPNLNPGSQPQNFGPSQGPNFNLGNQTPKFGPTNQSQNFNSGNQGPNFNSGNQGPNFNSGNQGPNFNSGNQGPNFNSGNQGPNFNSGNQGPNFNPLNQGSNFNPGNQGPNFNPGNQGPNFTSGKGPNLSSGNQGPHFASGKGPNFSSGNQGPNFSSGNQGPNFNSGNQGPNFNSGNQGPSFNAENQGPNFNTGNQGPHFNSGNQGPNFNSGNPAHNYPGNQGHNINAGNQGPNITPGNQGPSLGPGVQGSNFNSGNQGRNFVPGNQGPNFNAGNPPSLFGPTNKPTNLDQGSGFAPGNISRPGPGVGHFGAAGGQNPNIRAGNQMGGFAGGPSFGHASEEGQFDMNRSADERDGWNAHDNSQDSRGNNWNDGNTEWSQGGPLSDHNQPGSFPGQRGYSVPSQGPQIKPLVRPGGNYPQPLLRDGFPQDGKGPGPGNQLKRDSVSRGPPDNLSQGPRDNFPPGPRNSFPQSQRDSFEPSPREQFPPGPRDGPGNFRGNFLDAPRDSFPPSSRDHFGAGQHDDFQQGPRGSVPRDGPASRDVNPRDGFPGGDGRREFGGQRGDNSSHFDDYSRDRYFPDADRDRGWDQDSYRRGQFDDRDDGPYRMAPPPRKQPWESVFELEPATIVEYGHKPAAIVTDREVEPAPAPFLAPVQTFDYGHGAASARHSRELSPPKHSDPWYRDAEDSYYRGRDRDASRERPGYGGGGSRWERGRRDEEPLRKQDHEDERFRSDRMSRRGDGDSERDRDRRYGRESRRDDSGRNGSKSSGPPSAPPPPSFVATKEAEKATATKALPAQRPILIEDLLSPPGRSNRPPRIVVILRGPPGSGKTFVARLIKDKEVENGGSPPRILCLDDYFMVEMEKEKVDEETGRKSKVKVMEYEYEAGMERNYRSSLVKAFRKTVNDNYFPFIIVDCVNQDLKHFDEMWSYAKQKGFQTYICEMDQDLASCVKRNVHHRTEPEIAAIIANWQATPSYYLQLDVRSLLQSVAITEVEMEDSVPDDADPPAEEKTEEEPATQDEIPDEAPKEAAVEAAPEEKRPLTGTPEKAASLSNLPEVVTLSPSNPEETADELVTLSPISPEEVVPDAGNLSPISSEGPSSSSPLKTPLAKTAPAKTPPAKTPLAKLEPLRRTEPAKPAAHRQESPKWQQDRGRGQNRYQNPPQRMPNASPNSLSVFLNTPIGQRMFGMPPRGPPRRWR